MVICKQQSLRRHNFTGTSPAKDHHSVFQAGVVNTVYFFRGELQPELLHIFIIQTVDEHRDPHPFVGTQAYINKHDAADEQE